MVETPLPALSARVLAYLGDAWLNLKIREWIIREIPVGTPEILHVRCSQLNSANGQSRLLAAIQAFLTTEECEILRRGRNSPVAVGRRHNQKLHRQSTALEALFGHWYLYQPERLADVWLLVEQWLKQEK